MQPDAGELEPRSDLQRTWPWIKGSRLQQLVYFKIRVVLFVPHDGLHLSLQLCHATLAAAG